MGLNGLKERESNDEVPMSMHDSITRIYHQKMVKGDHRPLRGAVEWRVVLGADWMRGREKTWIDRWRESEEESGPSPSAERRKAKYKLVPPRILELKSLFPKQIHTPTVATLSLYNSISA